MGECHKCSTDKCPNRGEINVLKQRVNDIKKGYKGDKGYWRKVVKWLAITNLITIAELILYLTRGKEIVGLVIEMIIKKFIGG